MTRVLVCGGRDFEDEDLVHRVLDRYDDEQNTIRLVIHGNGGRWKNDLDMYGQPIPKSGADLWAGTWANIRGCPCMILPAAWRGLSVSAGPVRNGWMLEFGAPDLCIAFPGGRGTANMIKRCDRTRIEVMKIK